MSPEPLDAIFSALADPTRRAILSRLSRGHASIAELAAPFALTPRAISKHVAVLEAAGLIARGRDAQRRPARLRAEPLAEVDRWLETYRGLWDDRFDRLERRLAEQQKGRKR
jgi:DNA-binding transcriptional ArsR family regulator